MEEQTIYAVSAVTATPVAVNVTPETELPKVFEWKLFKKDWTKTIFSKKKMKERVNISLIYGFIKAEMGIAYQGNPRYDGVPFEIKTELDQVKYLRNQYDKKQKYIKMVHILPSHKWGRTIPIGYASLSVLHRPTRHRFCEAEYVDIDMVNCQPQLINEICRQREIKNKYLTKYNSNPKLYRQKIADFHGTDKDTAKQLFVRLMFGGTYNTWLKDNDIQVNAEKRHALPYEIETEMGAVIDVVYTANQHIVKDCLKQNPKKWQNEGEKKRGVMGLWSQTIERRMMEDSVYYLHENKNFVIEDVVPCQDGLMILKDLYYDDICKELEANLKEKYGFELKFVVKPFDEAIEIPEWNEVRSYEEWVDELSAKKLADRFVLMRGDYIINNNAGIYIYYDGRWYDETDDKQRHRLTRYISEDLYEDRRLPIVDAVELDPDECDELLKMLRTNTSNGHSFKDIVRHTLSIQAGKYSAIKFDEKPFLLGFENGVMELNTGVFRPYKYDDYITLTTQYEYKKPDYSSEENLAMRETLIALMAEIQSVPDALALLYLILCSALDGINYQKFWFYNGKGGNGKGLINRLMRHILGDLLSYSPKEELLKECGKSGGGASPDIADLRHKRYIIFTEMGGTIKLTSFRRLTGGDQFTGRQLYGGNQRFYLNATICGEFNNPPDFDAKAQEADYRRAIDFGFKNNWTDDPEKIDKEINGIFYRKANTYYTSNEFITTASPIFLDILLEHYKKNWTESGIEFIIPDDIRRASKKLVDGTNVFKQIFDELYEVVEDEKCEMKYSVIWSEIEHHEKYKGLNKQSKRQYTRDALYEWLEANFKSKGGNANRAMKIIGIRRKFEEEDNEEMD